MPFEKKINLKNELKRNFGKLRGGWGYPMYSLKPLHSDTGVLLESVTLRFTSKPSLIIEEPWIGFIHQPYNIPEWHPFFFRSPQELFKTDGWKKSIPFCRGIFALSLYSKLWLENQLDVIINNVIHPTPVPITKFSFENYLKNKNKQIIHIGWWLRKLHSIYHLPVKNLKKKNLTVYTKKRLEVINIHKEKFGLKNESSVENLSSLSNREYDLLLSNNIVFLDLWGASANNTVIECIVRNTPILINPLPAVVEYLGKDYPLYFNNLEEAAFKAENLDYINSAYKHLEKNSIKEKLTGEYFCKSIAESEIYRKL